MVPAHEPSQGATGPCLVPASQAKVARGLAWCPPASQAKVPRGLAWCPRAKPRHATRAMWPCLVPTSRAKTHDACHLPCHDSYNDPRYGARGCARTRDPCHDACHGPRHDTSRVPRPPCHGATTPVMTHSMVVEAVPRHMVRALSGFRP